MKVLRRGLPLIAALSFVLGTFVGASATSFSDLVTWDSFSGWVWDDEPFSYVHQLPQGTITSANLSLYGEMIQDGSIVHMTGTWDPERRTWSWNRSDLTILNFWNHQLLDVTVVPEGLGDDVNDFALHMISSELTGDYTPANGEVPEPNTLLLLGLGLMGMAGYGRFRMKKR